MLAGILLGVESRIPEDLEEAFRETGTAHIVVISGFNVTIVAGLFAVLFGALLNKRFGALAAAGGSTQRGRGGQAGLARPRNPGCHGRATMGGSN